VDRSLSAEAEDVAARRVGAIWAQDSNQQVGKRPFFSLRMLWPITYRRLWPTALDAERFKDIPQRCRDMATQRRFRIASCRTSWLKDSSAFPAPPPP